MLFFCHPSHNNSLFFRLFKLKKINLDILEGEIKEYLLNNNGESLFEICSAIHKIAKTPMKFFERVLENACKNKLQVDHGLDPVPVMSFSGRFVGYQNQNPQIILSVPR